MTFLRQWRTVVDCWETQVWICRRIWISLKAVSTGPVTSWNFNTVDLFIATTKEKRLRMKLIYGDSLRRHLCCDKRRTYMPFSMPNFTPCSESSRTQKFIYRMVFELRTLAQKFRMSKGDRYAPPPQQNVWLASSVRHGLTNLQPGPAQAHGL